METTKRVRITPAIFWPKDKPLAALVDLEFQTPDIELKVPLFELSLSLRKTQVVYVPDHLMEDFLRDPNNAVTFVNEIERGFIEKITSTGAYCRYFHPGSEELRTRANGEYTPFDNVFFYIHTGPYIIQRLWNELELK